MSTPTPSRGAVTFELASGSSIDFVRLYVGESSRRYDVNFDLREASLSGRRGMATEPGLARILNRPGVYFVALTSVSSSGQESAFSNEIRIDTRTQSALLMQMLSAGSLAEASGARIVAAPMTDPSLASISES